jgi:hypothetical protein
MLTGPSAAFSSRHHTRAASPQDYLEKIFQVPFTLPTVQPDGFRALLRNELHLLFEAKLASGALPSSVTSPPTSADGDSPTLALSPEVDEPIRRSPSVPSQRPENRDDTGSSASPRTSTPVPRVRPLFHLEPWEREFMTEKLVPFIATPRLIKRFANIYRLLRANIASDDEYQAFIRNHRDGAHRAVQVMLAANVGFPRFGSDLMRLLATGPAPSKEPVKAWSALLGQIDPTAFPAPTRTRAVSFGFTGNCPTSATKCRSRSRSGKTGPTVSAATPCTGAAPNDTVAWSRWAYGRRPEPC